MARATQAENIAVTGDGMRMLRSRTSHYLDLRKSMKNRTPRATFTETFRNSSRTFIVDVKLTAFDSSTLILGARARDTREGTRCSGACDSVKLDTITLDD